MNDTIFKHCPPHLSVPSQFVERGQRGEVHYTEKISGTTYPLYRIIVAEILNQPEIEVPDAETDATIKPCRNLHCVIS